MLTFLLILEIPPPPLTPPVGAGLRRGQGCPRIGQVEIRTINISSIYQIGCKPLVKASAQNGVKDLIHKSVKLINTNIRL